jgi:NAD+ synthase (glutamine-hydrolysing)
MSASADAGQTPIVPIVPSPPIPSVTSPAQLRIGLAQVNPTLGAIDDNCELIMNYVKHGAQGGAHLVVFPEMVVTGYPVEDLALRSAFRLASRNAVAQLATQLSLSGLGEIVVVVGYLDQIDGALDRLGTPVGAPQNALAVIYRNQVVATYAKRHLPNYGVFDEFRNFIPGSKSLVVRVHGIDLAFAICEDIWQDGGLMPEIAARTPGALIVINGSPYEKEKDDVRLNLISRRAREIGAPVAYVNLVGGQDELVFDGDSVVVNQRGETMARAPQFSEGLMLIDMEAKTHSAVPDVVISEEILAAYSPKPAGISPPLDREAEIWGALVTGLRDYVEKGRFKSVILGVSGGIDSALVTAIAVDAIGADRVHGVALPSKYSSDHSLGDAEELAKNTGIHFRVVPIQTMVDSYLDLLHFTGVAEENLQARVRGTTLMGISNQEGHLVLATGNKSELAVGYSTIYGDAVGGYAPIKDLWKSLVWELARWRNKVAITNGQTPPIPISSIEKEPSAELRPDQKDTDSLGDYLTLDQILNRYVTQDQSAQEIVAAGFDPTVVNRVVGLVDAAEYKRRQYPPGTKISTRAFGKDRRLPIISAWGRQAK